MKSYQRNLSVNRSVEVFLLYTLAMYFLCESIGVSGSCIGCLELDEINFGKIIKKFKYSMVKFDIAYPYGEKHEAYGEFAREVVPRIDDLIVTLVGVKDYGEEENRAIAEQYNVKESKFPVILLFKNYSAENWIQYPETEPITPDNIKKFIKENTDLYIGLEGCLKEMDEIAKEFPSMKQEDKLKKIDLAEEIRNSYDNNIDKEQGKVYIIMMKKIVEKGNEFILNEKRRLENLLKEKISKNKKRELTNRLNILLSFNISHLNTNEKEEL